VDIDLRDDLGASSNRIQENVLRGWRSAGGHRLVASSFESHYFDPGGRPTKTWGYGIWPRRARGLVGHTEEVPRGASSPILFGHKRGFGVH